VLDTPVRSIASELDPGSYSEVIDTAEGFQIILVEERKERRQKEFEEVRAELEKALRREDAPAYAQAAADAFLQDLEAKPDAALEEVAREKSIPSVQTAEPVSAQAPGEGHPLELVS